MTEVKQSTLFGGSVPISKPRKEVHLYISQKANTVKDNARFFWGNDINITKCVDSAMIIFDALRLMIPMDELVKYHDMEPEEILDSITEHTIRRMIPKFKLEEISETIFNFFNQTI